VRPPRQRNHRESQLTSHYQRAKMRRASSQLPTRKQRVSWPRGRELALPKAGYASNERGRSTESALRINSFGDS
jgi:hypothetical protein